MYPAKKILSWCFVLVVSLTTFSIFCPLPVTAASAPAEMIEAARQEGALNWVDSIIVPASAKAIAEAFKKHYGLPDGFKVNHQRLGTGPLSSRVAEEVKANKVTIDVFAAAVPGLFADLKKVGALLKHDSPEYKHYTRAREVGLPFDPGYWQSASAYCFAPITNPKVFGKPLKSWYDLLAPELKGGRIMFPPVGRGGSPLYSYFGWRKVLPKSFFEDLAKQEITFDRGSSVDATQRLTQGECLATITNPFRIVQTAAQTGIALDAHFPKEGVTLLGQPYGILAKGSHPNAAKLFLDFMFSEEGMKLYVDLEGVITLRDGMKVPDKIKKYSPPLSEINAIPMDWTKIDNQTLNTYRDEFKAIFKE